MFAYRSLTAYSGVLGILASGKGYVPLNPKFPVERSRKMLALSGCRVLIVGKEAFGQLAQLLEGIDKALDTLQEKVHADFQAGRSTDAVALLQQEAGHGNSEAQQYPYRWT